MFPILRTILWNATRSATLHISKFQNGVNLFHSLSKVPQESLVVKNFLTPMNVSVVPSCGFKVKGVLKRRCKDCYFVKREERLYVICKTHPRHKQMKMVKKEKNTWILTHATQGKIRAW